MVEGNSTKVTGAGESPPRHPLAARFTSFTKAVAKPANVLFTIIITFVGLTAITFIIGRVMPADPVLAIVGDRASKEVYEAMFLQLGLDKPLLQQYWIYLTNVVQGDFGKSIMTTRPVLDDLITYFPATLELASVATLIGILVGVPMGVAAAVRQGRMTDHIVRIIGLFGYSVPIFWLGLVALLIFYAKLGWLPGPGRIEVYYDGIVDPVTGFILIDSAMQGEWEIFRNAASHLVLPSAMLATFALAYIARMTRSFMIEQLAQEYVLAARAKGLGEGRVVWRHALGNAAVPLITVVALSYGSLLEGSVLTETVFAWPGLGAYLTNSLLSADMNAVLGATVVVGAVFIGINILSDALYAAVDPRTR
jgi:peptide/nickel transport system permease protein